MSEQTVKVKVTCPARNSLPGFWSAQRFFETGASEHVLPERVVADLRGEIALGVSILKIEVVEDVPEVIDPVPEAVKAKGKK